MSPNAYKIVEYPLDFLQNMGVFNKNAVSVDKIKDFGCNMLKVLTD